MCLCTFVSLYRESYNFYVNALIWVRYKASFSLHPSLSFFRGDKGDSIKASYVHHLDEIKRSAAVAEISRKFSTNENTFTVGGVYAVDHLTVLKAKLNNHGKLFALLQHEVIPKSLLTIASEFDTKALDITPKIGLSLALKP